MQKLQLNVHETDLQFRYLRHHLTWYCSRIYKKLQTYERKIVLVCVFEQL